MESITFEQVPKVITQLYEKLENIERLLLQKPQVEQPQTEQLITIKEAGKFLSLSVPTIYGLVSKAEIPVSKKEKRLYFSKQELTEWIKSGRKKTCAEITAEATNYINTKTK